MAVRVIVSSLGHEGNMSRVRISQGLEVLCLNSSTSASPACDRSAQGISLSTPILMMTFAVVGNVLALIVLYSSRREAHARRTVFFVMLSGLAWTDLIGQFAVSPIAIIAYANNLRWPGGTELCRYHGFMMVSFGLVTPLIVCCMSVERLLAIKFSYYYAKHVTRRKAQVTFLASWGVTALFTALPFVGFGSYEQQFPGTWCFLNFHRESQIDAVYAALFSSFNIVAIVTMIVCNFIVAATLFRMRRNRQLHSSPSIDRKLSASGACSTTSGIVIRARRHSDMEAQMIWFLCLITVAFSVCWLPLNVHILCMQFTGTTNRVLDLKFIRMASCNQILDPWLYVIFRKNSLLRIVRRLKACLGVVQQVPKEGQNKPPNMRYVISNKSYTYEATSLGKSVMGGNCCVGPQTVMGGNCCVGPHTVMGGNCCVGPQTAAKCCLNHPNLTLNHPNLSRQIQEGCEESRKNDCSECSSDSVAQLMSGCSSCDRQCWSSSASNPVVEISPGMSPYVSEAERFSYTISENASVIDTDHCASRHQTSSSLECTPRGVIGPDHCVSRHQTSSSLECTPRGVIGPDHCASRHQTSSSLECTPRGVIGPDYCASRHQTSSSLECTPRGVSEPLLEGASVKPKKAKNSCMKALDISVSTDSYGAYYSLDSKHQPSIIPANHSKPKKISLADLKQKSPFLGASKDSQSLSTYSHSNQPQPLMFLNSNNLVLLTSVTNPALTIAPRHEEHASLATDSWGGNQALPHVNIPLSLATDSWRGNQALPHVNIPLLLENIPESPIVKRNGHVVSHSKNQTSDVSEHVSSNLLLTTNGANMSMSMSMNVIDNQFLDSNDDIYMSSPVSSRGSDLTSRCQSSGHRKTRPYNGAIPDIYEEDFHLKRLFLPLKNKSTFSSKFFSTSKANKINKNSISIVGGKLGSSNSLHQSVDHSDHIKCFKSKKTPSFLGKNGQIAYLEGIRSQTSSCEHGLAELSAGSCP